MHKKVSTKNVPISRFLIFQSFSNALPNHSYLVSYRLQLIKRIIINVSFKQQTHNTVAPNTVLPMLSNYF